MSFVLPVAGGRITGRFNDPSKSNPQNIHAGIDIAPMGYNQVRAPEAGEAFAWIARRKEPGDSWDEIVSIGGTLFPFANYFYDMYGGVVVLRTAERTHLLCHCWGNDLFNRYDGWDWIEEKEEKRWPIFGVASSSVMLHAGAELAQVGNAGFSTGAHVHWEIHHGYHWNEREDRINPEEHLGGRQG